MWRRLSIQLRALSLNRSAPSVTRCVPPFAQAQRKPSPSFSAFSGYFSTESGPNVTPKRVEDVMPIATGHEREEIEAELQGRDILEINHPVGPFGTKEEPAVITSYFDKRIVGCPGGEGEDEHDVVWFWLEKGKPHECPVCSQYFVLEVVGSGGPPDGHGDDDDDDDKGHHY